MKKSNLVPGRMIATACAKYSVSFSEQTNSKKYFNILTLAKGKRFHTTK